MLALLGIVVFLAAVTIDFANARYVRAVHARNRMAASSWSLCMWALGCLGFVTIIDVSLWLMLPEGAGFFLGTWLAVGPPCDSDDRVARSVHVSGFAD